MAKPCPSCFQTEHCAPSCPELRWPDGRLRGTIAVPIPLPPVRNLADIPVRDTSPLSDEIAGIFAERKKP